MRLVASRSWLQFCDSPLRLLLLPRGLGLLFEGRRFFALLLQGLAKFGDRGFDSLPLLGFLAGLARQRFLAIDLTACPCEFAQ